MKAHPLATLIHAIVSILLFSASGTSNAAAYVSGVAALIVSAGKTDLVGRDVPSVALPPEQQGQGQIDALLTVQ